MALVPGSLPADEIDTAITETRDFIANGHTHWKPGSVVPLTKGGTGAATAAAARTALGLGDAAVQAANSFAKAGTNRVTLTWNGSELHMIIDSTNFGGIALKSDVNSAQANANSRVAKTGDTMSGHLFLPASSAATSGYTIAYINGDGRVSRGASSERFKKFISDIDPMSLGNLFQPFKRWQMRNGDGVWRYGNTAEQLAADPATEPFVVYERHLEEDGTTPHLERDAEGNPIPLSIDFIGLLMAQVAQLNARVAELEARA
jgi:hypothetical protein